jgi:methylenetetrahydrofolate reductase (NADPH)
VVAAQAAGLCLMKTFRDAIRTQDFVLTADLSLTPDSNAASVKEQARILGPHVDAIQVTENQYGAIHMCPLAAASILINEGIDPVMQLSCCNRNRAALIADLLGARSVGVTSVQLVEGKKMPDSYQPQPKQVKDLGVEELIATAKVIKEDSNPKGTAEFLIGAAVRARIPKPAEAMPRLLRKIDAGAQFIQTQLCFDADILRRYVAHLVSLKLTQRCSIVADVAALPSAGSARWLRDNLRHVVIPPNIIRRLERAENPEQEGIAICSEQLREIATIPGVSAANVITMGGPNMIVEAIEASGLRGA